jgi:hypothetical protein
MNMKFEARMRMLAGHVEIAGGNLEMPMNEVHQPVRQVPRKIRAVIRRAILLKPSCDVDARVRLGRQFDVRVSLIVAQQNVVARLVLLDQVVFKRQRFFFVVDLNDIDMPRFTDQSPGFDVGQTVVIKIAAHAAAQVFRLADVDDGAMGVLI